MPKLPPFGSSRDKTPKYTVKEVAEMMELSTYTVRYYENAGLVPEVDRSEGNIRLFSDYSLGWLRLVHCLRATGLPIEGVRRYIVQSGKPCKSRTGHRSAELMCFPVNTLWFR